MSSAQLKSSTDSSLIDFPNSSKSSLSTKPRNSINKELSNTISHHEVFSSSSSPTSPTISNSLKKQGTLPSTSALPSYQDDSFEDSEWQPVDAPTSSPKNLFSTTSLSPLRAIVAPTSSPSTFTSPSLVSLHTSESRRSPRLQKKDLAYSSPVSIFRTMLAKLHSPFQRLKHTTASKSSPLLKKPPNVTMKESKKNSYPTDTSALLLNELIPSDSEDEDYYPTYSDISSDSESDLEPMSTNPNELLIGPVQPSYLVDWLSIQMYHLDHHQHEKLKHSQRTLHQLIFSFFMIFGLYCSLFKRIPWHLDSFTFLNDLRIIKTWITYFILQLAIKVQAIFGSLN